MELAGIREKLEGACRLLLRPRCAILALVFLASVIRLLPMRFKYLIGYDPYFHLAYIRYALEKGEWVNFFPYATGPWGFQVRQFHPLGLWMTPAYVYKLLSPFGVSLYNAFRVTPVIFGVFTVIFTYLAVLKLYGKKEAFLSAFFLAVSFGHVFRSMAGYYRGDNYMLFWYSVALFGISLALSKNDKRWEYRRLVFYIIPAFASGFSAIFWQAYYPIFIFLLESAIFMAVGAFLLEERNAFVDATALVIATGLGALLANFLSDNFGMALLGEGRPLGEELAEKFGLQFGFINDAFLLMFLKYAVPISAVAILGMFVFSSFLRERKQRVLLVGIGVVVVLWLWVKYYGTVDEIIQGMFPSGPISEVRMATFRDLWVAYGISLFLVPTFFLSFLPKRVRIQDFLLLGFAIVVLPMGFLWVRFLFLASLAVALMVGIGLVRVYHVGLSRFKALRWGAVTLIGVLIFLPVATCFQGVQNTLDIRPFVNDAWKEALTYLGADSNINDVVLTWWDQGNWVTYYSNRAPVSQLAPDKFVAEYYLGRRSEKSLMERGVDYVVVSYDTVLKFGAILNTANASPSEYAMIPMPLVSSPGGVFIFSGGVYSIMVVPGENSWSVEINAGGVTLLPREVFVEKGRSVERVSLKDKPNADAYVYINLNYGYAVLMNGNAFDTPLARLMFTGNQPNFTEIYSDGGYIKIFRFEHPNVVVTSENGSVVLRFTNSTGTTIRIFGYLDNGTMVFKRQYEVKGKNEFVLPADINGSVVVRYVCLGDEGVLDGGVFRIDDVVSSRTEVKSHE
ncbi:oligosaccharyl transferase, STT3 subunit [Thermococcus sp. MV11]|uniref:oligosaccharyl transferase, STT3 subunit n=1 Tax=Thermococcus sp. MV11 TaxID=1638267 RepID=UPI00143078F4|nr:oligosaccharyl transferase, STT3 subunit [Thermococcus sp. MV11]NJE03858.1 oligosaccharyl transferase, STT3 subunit [Thermococcus sp. MV11]